MGVTLGKSKLKILSAKICLHFNWGEGGGALRSEIPERGSLENLDTNLLFEVSVQKPSCASQIVSHILCMWRLTRRYPLGIQRLVSTHFLGLGVYLGNSKLKVPSPGPDFYFRGGGLFLTTQNSKSKVLAKFRVGGGGILGNSSGQLFIGGGGVFLASQELVLLAKWRNNVKLHSQDQALNFPLLLNKYFHFTCFVDFMQNGIFFLSKAVHE